MPGDTIRPIEKLVYRYAELLDSGDLDGVAALFEHATWASARAHVQGTSAVRRMYDGVILYDDGTPRTKHVITNLVIEHEEGSTQASARSYFTVMQAVDGLTLQPVIAGRYHDRFEEVEGVWRFAERTILPDLYGDLSHHMRGPTR